MNKSRFFALITVLTWATNSAVIKSLLGEIPNMQALFLGSAVAFVYLLAVNLKSGIFQTMKSA